MTSAMCNALLGMICIEAVGTRNAGRLARYYCRKSAVGA